MRNIFFTPVSLATLCMLAAHGAQAQSSVRLYGIVDVSVRQSSGLSEFTPSNLSTTAVVSGINNTSRWGLRVQEDLGEGLHVLDVVLHLPVPVVPLLRRHILVEGDAPVIETRVLVHTMLLIIHRVDRGGPGLRPGAPRPTRWNWYGRAA